VTNSNNPDPTAALLAELHAMRQVCKNNATEGSSDERQAWQGMADRCRNVRHLVANAITTTKQGVTTPNECPRCGAGPLGNCGAYGAEIPRERCPIATPAKQQGVTGDLTAIEMLDWFRRHGWMVAVHNDYRQHGRLNTFWLLTHPCGKWVKGEGADDALALRAALTAALQAGEVVQGWRDIASVPTPVDHARTTGICKDDDKLTWWQDGNPTHWMPLPAAPTEANAERE